MRLSTQYEDRAVAPASLPYSGEPVDNVGVPPRPWDLPVASPQDFEDRILAVAVPHTERVQVCPPCVGSGRVVCPHCHGSGRASCSGCMGVGSKSVTQPVTHVNADGTHSVRTETGSHVCPFCGGAGRVGCPPCAGSGRQICSACRGQGRLKTYDQLTVHFRPATQTAVLDETELADGQLQKVTGEVLVDERSSRIAAVPGVTPAVDHRVARMLTESHAVTEGSSRVLFQRIHVERILIQEVAYRYAGSPARRFWIYGGERRTLRRGAGPAWGRWAAVVGVIVTAIAAVIFAIVHSS